MESDKFLITPMTKKVLLKAGESYTGKIKVANPANSTREFSFVAEVSPYGVAGEDYTADLKTKSNRTMMADWITLEEAKGTLEPNGTADINYTITVPKDAPAGAQYAAIVVSQDKNEVKKSGMNIDNIVEIASIIYGEVEGETVMEGQILGNEVPGFSTTAPITVSARFDNHGNVYDSAMITITAKNNLTGEVYLPTETNEGVYEELILPDTTREVKRDVEGLPFLGIVHIEQSISYNGETSTVGKDVIICPVWFMVLFAVVMTALVALVVRLTIKHRRAKTRVEI